MKRRYKLKKRHSRSKFKRGISRTHKFNLQSPIMRGGIRL